MQGTAARNTRSQGVVVTGSSGLVGSALVRALRGRGWHTVGLDQRDGDQTDLVLDLASDLPAEPFPPGCARDRPLILHAAALTPPRATQLEAAARTTQTNVTGTARVVRWASQLRAARVLMLSSASVYGNQPATVPSDEEAPTRPEGVYASTKLAGEVIARAVAVAADLPLQIVRLSQVYGRNEEATNQRPLVSVVARWRQAAQRGESVEVAAGEHLCDLLHADEAAEALACIAEGVADGAVLNVAHPRPQTYGAVAHAIASRFAVPITQVPRTADTVVRPPLDTGRLVTRTGWDPGRSIVTAVRDVLSVREPSGHAL